MIVISGALVLVALVLLVIGLVGPSLGFVYASIGASLAAFAFLVFGILQRRKEEPSVGEGVPTSAAELAAVIRTPEQATATAAIAAEDVAEGGLVGEVLVVQGRPRYHVVGCRYLTGKSADSVEVTRARQQGFTACGVCKPDEALAAAVPATGSEVLAMPETAEVASGSVTLTRDATTLARSASAKADRAGGGTTVSNPAKAVKTATAPASKAARKPAAKPAAAVTAKAAPKARAATAAKAAGKAPAKAAVARVAASTAVKPTAAKAGAAKAAGKAPVRAAAKAPAKPAAKAAAKAVPSKAAAKKTAARRSSS